LVKKNYFKMNVTFHFQYNFNFFLPTLPTINTLTFLLHNFQYNFKFVFFLGSLVKLLYLMIISFHSLIHVQLAKTTLILKRMKYLIVVPMLLVCTTFSPIKNILIRRICRLQSNYSNCYINCSTLGC